MHVLHILYMQHPLNVLNIDVMLCARFNFLNLKYAYNTDTEIYI